MTCQFCKGTKKIEGFSSFYDCTECIESQPAFVIPEDWLRWGGWGYAAVNIIGHWVPVTAACDTKIILDIANFVQGWIPADNCCSITWPGSTGFRYKLVRQDKANELLQG